jgi:hypothetical protein
VPAAANRLPTAASYLRRPCGAEFAAHRRAGSGAFKFEVLRIEGWIAEATTFGAELLPAVGLPGPA